MVVDDGSIDNSLELLKSFQKQDRRITFIERNREPKGASTCRNIGLHFAKGEYVIFLDSDDYLLPFCIEQRIKHFKKHPKKDFLVFPMGIQIRKVTTKKEIEKSNSYLIDYLSYKLAWSIMCPIWKRCFLNKIGGFKEGYPRFNDPELMIRALSQKGVSFKVFHDVNYDTVYVPAKMSKQVYKDKVYKSLLMFVPDITKFLEKEQKSDYKEYLAMYLHLWYKSFFIPLRTSRINESIKLINLFYKLNIISFKSAAKLIYYTSGYALTRTYINHFKWKLTDSKFYTP